MRSSLEKLAAGVVEPVSDTKISLGEIDKGLQRLESRNVFGKIVVTP
jgi:alcohol dehydrogenase